MKKNFTKKAWIQLFVPRNLFLLVGLCAILLTIGAHPLSAQSSRNSKITLELSNVTVKNVIEKIKEQSDYTFFIDTDDVDLNRRISIDLVDKSIRKILDAVVAGQKIRYKINGNQITLSSVKPGSRSQLTTSTKKRTVSGAIKDQSGESIVGATIMVKGTTIGITSDIDGNYSLNVTNNSTLVFSFLGYMSQEIEVAQKSIINVTLKEDNELLDEVVVIGFGTQKKVNLTGAVTSVKMNEALGDRPIVNLATALQSVAPGLEVNIANGSPGQDPTFNIRGTGSINEGAEPLVLVNNVPMSMDMINPHDIESVSILKDAASSAIYGARAAFGVILITTKQGKKDLSPTFNYSNNFSLSSPAYLPEKASPLESVQAYKKIGFTNGDYVDGTNIEKWEGHIKDYLADPSKYPTGYMYDDEGALFLLRENDMFGDMMDTPGFMQNHNLSVSGGSERSTYNIGFGYTGEDGVLITDKDKYERLNLSAFLGIDLNKWLTTQLDVRYTNSKQSIVEHGGRGGIWGITLPSYINTEDVEINGIMYPSESSATYIENGEPRKIDVNNLRTLGRVILKPFENLKITGEYTFDRRSSKNSFYRNQYEYVGQNLEEIRQSIPSPDYAITQEFTNYNAINIFGNYSLNLGKHEFTFTGGYNQEFSHDENQFSKKDGVFIENLPSLGLASGIAITSDSFNEFAIRGLFYGGTYNYNGIYFLEATGRYDGSSRFPKDSRFGFFPSFAGAYRISEEVFMESLKGYLSNLKLRVSYGTIGNQSVGTNYPYIPAMKPYQSDWLIDDLKSQSINPPAMVSSNFSWEEVSTLNFGLDLALLNNRLNSEFNWYRRDTKGMLAPGMELPHVIGTSAARQNVADLKTYGWELTLNWRDRINDFGYRIGFNLYDSQSEITKYDNESGLFGDKRYREGMKLGEIWGYTTDRFATDADFEADGSLKDGIPMFHGQGVLNPGDVIFKNLDDDAEKIFWGENTESNPGDRSIIGNSKYRYQYGINLGLNYKGFDLSVFLRGVGKRDFVLNTWPTGGWGSLFKHTLDFWSPDNLDAYYPRVYEYDGTNTSYNRQVQTKYLANGAFLKIQNVTLSYTLPKDITDRMKFKNVKVFVSGENLHTFDKLAEGLNPETSGVWNYPYMKKYSFGINVSF